MFAVARLAAVGKWGCENCIELQQLGGALARLRRRKRFFELLLPQLNELLNVVVVQIHGTHGTGPQRRLAEGEYCRLRLTVNPALFILRFRFRLVKTPADSPGWKGSPLASTSPVCHRYAKARYRDYRRPISNSFDRASVHIWYLWSRWIRRYPYDNGPRRFRVTNIRIVFGGGGGPGG